MLTTMTDARRRLLRSSRVDFRSTTAPAKKHGIPVTEFARDAATNVLQYADNIALRKTNSFATRINHGHEPGRLL